MPTIRSIIFMMVMMAIIMAVRMLMGYAFMDMFVLMLFTHKQRK